MTLDQIRYFIAVAEAGLMHQAAARVGISQPALTQALQRLEAELGFSLFERHAKGMTLTAYGSEFLADAQHMWRTYDDSMNRLNELRAAELAQVRIGATPATEMLIDRAFLSLLKSRPALKLVSRIELSDALIGALAAGHIDAAVAPLPDNLPREIGARPLFEESSWVVCRSGHPLLNSGRPVRSGDLARYSWVLPKKTVFARRQIDAYFSDRGLNGPNLQFERNFSSSSGTFFVLANSDLLGICSTQYQALANHFGLCRIDAEGACWPRHLSLLTRAEGKLSPLTATFVDHLGQEVSALLAEDWKLPDSTPLS